ncbi:hypothetical protein [Natronobacterium haloterrestre]|nr:hypothetical protein [Halobiforma haloterrestris]
MSDTQDLKSTLREYNEDGQLYLVGGVISAIISWVLIPLFGLLAVFCGYKLYDEEEKVVSSSLMATMGGIGFLMWLAYLATMV